MNPTLAGEMPATTTTTRDTAVIKAMLEQVATQRRLYALGAAASFGVALLPIPVVRETCATICAVCVVGWVTTSIATDAYGGFTQVLDWATG